MKTTRHFLPLFLLTLSPLAPALDLPTGDSYVCATAPRTSIPAAEYRGHLLPAMQDYLFCLRHSAQPELKTYRHAAFDVARRFPAEVNDLLQRADGSWATPLSMAVQAQDAEMVDLLLKLGALPFGPNAAYPLSKLPPLEGVVPDEQVKQLLHKAQQGYNPMALILENKLGTTPKKPLNAPPSASLSPTLRQLAETYENTYLGEPGVADPGRLYLAFNRLGGAQNSLLRVQPISHIIVQPEENTERGGGHYGAIITTGRVVDALTGVLPTCEFITWEIAHEGRIEEGSKHPALRDEPVFFSLYPKRLEKASQEDNHLKLGYLNTGEVCYGEEWQAAFDRVLADYPEKAEPLAASAEDLATARELMEEVPVMLRARIFRTSITLDEAAGQVHVSYLASPRDPLQGALIKGALRDWGNIEYHRSFPLDDEWRQRYEEGKAGKSGAWMDLPVILCLAPSGQHEEGNGWVNRNARQPMQVLRAFDARDDAPMLRALNEAAFRPWASAGE